MADTATSEKTMDTDEAFERTDRHLRRIARLLPDDLAKGDDELGKALKRARRQLRANRDLLPKFSEGSKDESGGASKPKSAPRAKSRGSAGRSESA